MLVDLGVDLVGLVLVFLSKGSARLFARLVHLDLFLGVDVDSEADGVLIEIVDGVKVLEEGVTDEVKISVLSGESALVNHEEALIALSFVEILLGSELEHVVTHLESDILHFWADFLASVGSETEGWV